MKWKGWIAIMLIAALFGGCAAQQSAGSTPAATEPEITQATAPQETIPQDAPLEDRLPALEGNALRMYYDDRYALSLLGGETAEIAEQIVVSTAVGSGEKDANVVICENGMLIAVGIGTAQVTVGDAVYAVSVEAAPISLVMITGHSIGAGQAGTPAQSVLCAPGTAYSTHFQQLSPSAAIGVGIGYAASARPREIDAFTAAGAGVQGEASGLAYKWNALTGEKIWVLNAAVGGSCLNEWAQGTENYARAVHMFQYAQAVLANEISAGHYRLKDMAVIYHSGANFGYKNVVCTDELAQECLQSLWNGMKEDLSVDLNGDGIKETISAMGYVPTWNQNNRKVFEHDKPATYYMAASDAYPGIFMASEAAKVWTGGNGLQEMPPIDYDTHGQQVTLPENLTQLYAEGTHFVQSAYNALGMDIAANLFRQLRSYSQVESLIFQKPDGNKVYTKVTLSGVGDSLRLIPVTQPITVSDLTFQVTENLSLEYPCILVAKAAGEGKLTVSQRGTVVAEITVIVED